MYRVSALLDKRAKWSKRRVSAQKRVELMEKKHGPRFRTLFEMHRKEAVWRFYGLTPGDAIDIQVSKMLCKDSAQAALDSHRAATDTATTKTTANAGHAASASASTRGLSDGHTYTFDVGALTDSELYTLKKEINLFSSLGNVLDCRHANTFAVLTRLDDGNMVVCRVNEWINVVRSDFVGGFENLYSASCIQQFSKYCGMLAGCINYSNILKVFEDDRKINLTSLLLNVFLLNAGSEKVCPITRNGTKFRREFLSRSSFEMCREHMRQAQLKNETDGLNENYARIIMQLPPLSGSNFNCFSVLREEKGEGGRRETGGGI